MKKLISLTLAILFVLCLCVPALAAGGYTVTVINGMDGSVYDTFEVAEGEDFVFNISGSPPCDMGPIADGEAGSGVTTTVGAITYSNVTLGGPNQYPTAETVTVSGINADATVTITPNPLEVGSEFPAFALGEGAAGGASGEASSDEPSGEASGEASDEPYPLFEEYKQYLLDTLLLDPFWQGSEDLLRADLAAAETPDDENIQHFTGSGDVDQAPAGVVFPMTYDVWYAENGGGAALSVEDAFIEYIHEWLIAEDEINDNMDENIRENEFMPLVREMNFTDFPAEMIYNGMLEQGVPMTFEEFAAQYVPAAAPAGGGYTVDEAGWKQYLKDYVSACPAAQEHLDEFFAAIDAGEFYTMPGDMLFQDTFWGYSAATYDEFVAANGAVEIPAFDPTLAPDAEP